MLVSVFMFVLMLMTAAAVLVVVMFMLVVVTAAAVLVVVVLVLMLMTAAAVLVVVVFMLVVVMMSVLLSARRGHYLNVGLDRLCYLIHTREEPLAVLAVYLQALQLEIQHGRIDFLELIYRLLYLAAAVSAAEVAYIVNVLHSITLQTYEHLFICLLYHAYPHLSIVSGKFFLRIDSVL